MDDIACIIVIIIAILVAVYYFFVAVIYVLGIIYTTLLCLGINFFIFVDSLFCLDKGINPLIIWPIFGLIVGLSVGLILAGVKNKVKYLIPISIVFLIILSSLLLFTQVGKGIPKILQRQIDIIDSTDYLKTQKILYVHAPHGLNLRSFSSINSKIVAKLVNGTKLIVLKKVVVSPSQNISWFKVRTLSGDIGWVYSGRNRMLLSNSPISSVIK